MEENFKYIFNQAILDDETVDLIEYSQEIETVRKSKKTLEISYKCHSLDEEESHTLLFKGEPAPGLFHVEWNEEIKKYVFRKVEQIFTPLSKKPQDESQEEKGVKISIKGIDDHFTYSQDIQPESFTTRIEDALRNDQKYFINSTNQDDYQDITKESIRRTCLQHYEMLKHLRRAVIVNTIEFCDLFRSIPQIDVIEFLMENTTDFRGRRLINNSFYPKKLHEMRNKMIKDYDLFNQEKATNTEYWLWEEMHSYERGLMRLKGYDEAVIESAPLDFVPEKIHMDLIKMEYSLKKMISLQDIAHKLQVPSEIVLKYFSLSNFVKLCNGKYTKEKTTDHVRNQIVTILQNSDIIKRKEISFPDEKHFKKVLKEYCEYEKGQWRIRK